MTDREAVALAERVERWQHRLGLLGLEDWRIESVHVVDETPGGPDANATVRPSYAYRSCVFWFKEEYVDRIDESELDETIIHEWLHVFYRDLDKAVESIDQQLAPAAREVWEDRVEHEREDAIDTLSRQLYALYSKN